jgi:hypothetical protein
VAPPHLAPVAQPQCGAGGAGGNGGRTSLRSGQLLTTGGVTKQTRKQLVRTFRTAARTAAMSIADAEVELAKRHSVPSEETKALGSANCDATEDKGPLP